MLQNQVTVQRPLHKYRVT